MRISDGSSDVCSSDLSTPIDRAVAEQVAALAAEAVPGTQIVFHPQCFESWRHFAGEDSVRAEAFLAVANDPRFDALWFARGGYGSCRIAEDVLSRLGPAAREKSYRSEERRVGEEGVRPCRSRWSPYH